MIMNDDDVISSKRSRSRSDFWASGVHFLSLHNFFFLCFINDIKSEKVRDALLWEEKSCSILR